MLITLEENKKAKSKIEATLLFFFIKQNSISKRSVDLLI